MNEFLTPRRQKPYQKEQMHQTPKNYWRIACPLDGEGSPPQEAFVLPDNLAAQTAPPKCGDGLLLAAYDPATQTGQVRQVGVVTKVQGIQAEVTWRPVAAEIWVDTPAGRGFWLKGSFRFADRKVPGYGIAELFAGTFDDMEFPVRPDASQSTPAPRGTRPPKVGRIPSERLVPMEVVGGLAATPTARSGVVYVLKSAYGYKVGRTRDVPSRMRTFGVQLPFIYTIPLCAWFDDCHEAEKRYHTRFASKRINGEWFDLNNDDIEQIRLRA